MHSAMVNEWASVLTSIHVSQIRYTMEHIKSGQSEFSQYPPNCIQFGEMARAFIPYRETKRIARDQPKDWRDMEVDERVAQLKRDPEWPEVVRKARNSGKPVEYLLAWSRRRHTEGSAPF